MTYDLPVRQRTVQPGSRFKGHYRYPAEPPAQLAVQWRCAARGPPFLYQADRSRGWSALGPVAAGVGEKALEVSVPCATLGLAQAEETEPQLRVLVVLAQDGDVVANCLETAMATIPLASSSSTAEYAFMASSVNGIEALRSG